MTFDYMRKFLFGLMAVLVLFMFGALVYETFQPTAEDMCREDCPKLNTNYFKHEYGTSGGLFGGGESANCYCVDGDLEVKQIW